MKKALVLGCGLIGKTIALDLSEDFDVTVLDFSRKSLDLLGNNPRIKKIEGSAADLNFLAGLVKGNDIVCGVLPGMLDGPAKRLVVELGVNYVSPSGFRNAEGLDELAKDKGVTAVFDMGVSPGMANYLVGRGAHLLDDLDEGIIYVCGIPQDLDPPFNYRTVFCLEDTLNEYIRPARYVDDWQVKVAPALSGLEEIDIPEVGKLEAFFTDGLRSAADNVKGRFIAEKTMRWPGYVDAINILKAAGLLDIEPVDFSGIKIVPKEFASALLGPRWELRPDRGDRDYTIMRVIAKGNKGCDRVSYTWDMVDKFDENTMIHSMARTTAYPCVATARAIAGGIIRERGFIAPELLASDDKFYGFLMGEQKKHGIIYRETAAVEKP